MKMIFSVFPLTCRGGGDPGDRLREAEDWPKHYRSSADQLTNKRIKLSSFRFLTQDGEAFNHEREHPPRTHGVLMAATGEPRALFMKDRQRALAIATISHLA